MEGRSVRGTVLIVVLLAGVSMLAAVATTLQWVTLDLRTARQAERRAWIDAVARSTVDLATASIAAQAAATGRIDAVPPPLPDIAGVEVTWTTFDVDVDGTVDFDVSVSSGGWTSHAGGRWPRER